MCTGTDWEGTDLVITLDEPSVVSIVQIMNVEDNGMVYAKGLSVTAGNTLCGTTPNGALDQAETVYDISCSDVPTDTITITTVSVIRFREVRVFTSTSKNHSFTE